METGVTPKIGPFYFQTGFVYTGLIPHRDKDQAMVAIGYGAYSSYNVESLQAKGNVNQPNYTLVLEAGSRFAINEWAFIQPFAQYLVQPSGTGAGENATVLGFSTGLTF